MTDNVVDFNKEKSKTEDADKSLREAIGKFETVLVIGINDNEPLGFVTNRPNYAWMQYIFSKGSFDLHLHERQSNETK